VTRELKAIRKEAFSQAFNSSYERFRTLFRSGLY